MVREYRACVVDLYTWAGNYVWCIILYYICVQAIAILSASSYASPISCSLIFHLLVLSLPIVVGAWSMAVLLWRSFLSVISLVSSLFVLSNDSGGYPVL